MNAKKLKKAMKKAKSNIKLFETRESGSVKVNKKGYRGVTTKRSKPTSTGIKKTQAATKTYTPKKKTYAKPDLGSAPMPDFHVYGAFDGIASNKGIASALNRVEREHPGTYEILQTYVNEGSITWKEIESYFATYYYDRPAGEEHFNYLTDPYAVYESGYQNFMEVVLDHVTLAREEMSANAV